MKFLLDQNVSPALVGLLADADHLAEHVRDLGMREAPDDVVLAAARDAGAVLISSALISASCSLAPTKTGRP